MRLSPLDKRRIEFVTGLAESRRASLSAWLAGWAHVLWRRLPALLPALLFLPVVLAPPVNHDAAAVLQFSQRWLAGEHLYSDLIDVNPPLIFVLNLVPAWIASVTPLDGVAALRLCLLAYGAFCWWLAARVRERRREGPVERAFLDVLPALFLLDAGYDFGQREHLMAVGALPYLLAASRRAAGEAPRGRIACALLAALVFALKPHFLGVPALAELTVLLGRAPEAPLPRRLSVALRRWLRDPVPWAMLAVWLAYLASLPLLFPDYLTVVLPLVRNFYVELGGLSIGQVLLVPRMATILCLLLPLLFLAFRRPDPLRLPGGALPRMLALAAVAALVSALVQHKGWSYHILPIELFTCGLGGVLAARWLDRHRAGVLATGPYNVAAMLGGLFALYAVSNGEAPWRELAYSGDQVAGLTALLEPAAGERVLVLSPGVYPIYPALNYAGVQSTARMTDMWLLQGAYAACLPNGRRYREVWEMGRSEFFIYRTVAEDFARAPPAAVLVDMDPGIPWCGSQFDFVAYFQRHPLFAEVWSRYRLAAEWGRYRLYTPKD